MSLVQAQTVNFLIVSGTKVDGGLKATISCTDGSVFVKNLFETQEVAFAGNWRRSRDRAFLPAEDRHL